MKNEIKILYSPFKIVYSIVAIIILPLVRGISNVTEIGIAMEPFISILAIAIFADTYYIEISNNTSETFYIMGKDKYKSILIRIFINWLYVMILSTISFWIFLIQKPYIESTYIIFKIFGQSIIAFSATILFWGVFSFTIVNLLKKLWTGIGIAIFINSVMSSALGRYIPNIINIFSYGNINNQGEEYKYWIFSKLIYSVIAIILLLYNKKLLEKSPISFKRRINNVNRD